MATGDREEERGRNDGNVDKTIILMMMMKMDEVKDNIRNIKFKDKPVEIARHCSI